MCGTQGCTRDARRRRLVCPAGRRHVHAFNSEKFRFSSRKPLYAPASKNACASSRTNHAPQLPDRKPFVLFSGNPPVSASPDTRCISFRRNTPHRICVYLRIPEPAKLTRLLATCAAPQNVISRRDDVKQFVMRTQKNFARESIVARVTSPNEHEAQPCSLESGV